MRDDLMPEEVEIDPVIRTAPLFAAQQPAVKGARGSKIMDGESEVEGASHAAILSQPTSRVIALVWRNLTA